MFTGKAAGIVSRQRWHPEQEISESPDGIILELPVNDDRELFMKILQFGHHACVLEPEGLQEKIKTEIKKMAVKYKIRGN